MAALRALTMATTIQATSRHPTGCVRAASSAPVSANGSAKTEWLNRTKDPQVRRVASMAHASSAAAASGVCARSAAHRMPAGSTSPLTR